MGYFESIKSVLAKSKIASLLLFTSLASYSVQLEADIQIKNYDRVILGLSELVEPNGDPLPVVDVNTLIDPHNLRMLSLGNGAIYDQAKVDAMRSEAFTYFKDTYGLDFLSGAHDPISDVYALPNALLIQVTRAGTADTPIQLDTANKKRSGKWYGVEAGVLVLMVGNGQYTGGLRNGLIYFNNDLLSKYTYSFCKPDSDLSNPNNREDVKGFPDWPSRQTANSFGAADTFGQVRVVDDQGNTGYLVSVVDRVRLLNNNWATHSRVIISWPSND